ncbi:MAG: hypothetical protein U9R43_02085 [Thermodesulfobacteriota bacterium]|nr:hypothetical protein [Thermodesulfobacteriota bacterium]
MPVIQTSLFSVIKRFPDRKDIVRRLFKESENFKAVCEDYRKCSEALHHWNESASDEAPVRREEYAALLRDLEAEILQSLDEYSRTPVKQNQKGI